MAAGGFKGGNYDGEKFVGLFCQKNRIWFKPFVYSYQIFQPENAFVQFLLNDF